MPGNGGIGGGSCTLDFKVWKKGGNQEKPDDKWDCKDMDADPAGHIEFTFPPESTGSVPGTVRVPIRKGVRVKINWS